MYIPLILIFDTDFSRMCFLTRIPLINADFFIVEHKSNESNEFMLVSKQLLEDNPFAALQQIPFILS